MVHRITGASVIGLSLMAAPLHAQSPTSVVNKLGVDQDIRSGMKVLMDEVLGGQ